MKRENLIKEFSKCLQEGTGVCFIGAGVSKASGFKDWNNLLKTMQDDIDIEISVEDDLTEIAQYIVNANMGNKGRLLKEIENNFVKKNTNKINKYHRALAQTNISTIWTTNYDTMLEKSFENQEIVVRRCDSDLLAGHSLNNKVEIIKMHGCIENLSPSNIVITKEDYEDYNITHPLTTERLRSDLLSKSFLFVGYSYRDPNIQSIMTEVRHLCKRKTMPHYIILEKEKDYSRQKLQKLWIEDLLRYGINTYIYETGDYEDLENCLKEISIKSRGNTIYVTGSHENYEEQKKLAEKLGENLVRLEDSILMNGQSEGIGKTVLEAFIKYGVEKKLDIHKRLKMYANPYASNKEWNNDDNYLSELKEFRLNLLKEAHIMVMFNGSKGTKLEYELAIEMGTVVIPVIISYDNLEEWMNIAIEKCIEIIKKYDMNYANKLIKRESIGNEDISQCITNILYTNTKIESAYIEISGNEKIQEKSLQYKTSLKSRDSIRMIGKNQKVLVNSLIGYNTLSTYNDNREKLEELCKMKNGPDIITDVSTLFDKSKKPFWEIVSKETDCIAGTVPIYFLKDKNNIKPNELLEVIHEQVEGGVGIVTIHLTPTDELLKLATTRIVPYTSRGGRIVIENMKKTGKNIYLELLPKIIDICKTYNSVISIGTTFRTANIIDSFDIAQKRELEYQLELADVISSKGVGVIIEAPGHASPQKIRDICKILSQKPYPVMPLGPIPTDIAIGNDHVSSAIGVTLMGLEGKVQIISAVTREEHTGEIPETSSIIEAVTTAKIAAHIIDIDRINDYEEDFRIAMSRKKSCISKGKEGCSRCSEYCPLVG